MAWLPVWQVSWAYRLQNISLWSLPRRWHRLRLSKAGGERCDARTLSRTFGVHRWHRPIIPTKGNLFCGQCSRDQQTVGFRIARLIAGPSNEYGSDCCCATSRTVQPASGAPVPSIWMR
jgi:hypothetical protein